MKANYIRIGNKKIGKNYCPFIVAEMSGNHNHSLERALSIIDLAAEAGAHAVKLQTYTADTMTLDVSEGEFFLRDNTSLWQGQSLYNLYKKAYTPWEWHQPLIKRAKKNGIMCFSTPFDETAVDFLETLNVPAYKIASFENTHLPLIRKVAMTGKPLIISTGMASLYELKEVVNIVRDLGCKKLVLLKCTSSYPAKTQDCNLKTIPHMREIFDCEVGLSDHCMGVGAAVAAVACGATIIEKHFTIKRSDGGVDSAFSIEPEELKQLVKATDEAWQSLGRVTYGTSNSERESVVFRRSLYIAKDMKKNDQLTKNNMRIVRPGHGLAPKYYDELLGRKINRNAKKGQPVNWDIISVD